jgi:hypothetical protein
MVVCLAKDATHKCATYLHLASHREMNLNAVTYHHHLQCLNLGTLADCLHALSSPSSRNWYPNLSLVAIIDAHQLG